MAASAFTGWEPPSSSLAGQCGAMGYLRGGGAGLCGVHRGSRRGCGRARLRRAVVVGDGQADGRIRFGDDDGAGGVRRSSR